MTQTKPVFPITLFGQWQSPSEALLASLSNNLSLWLLDKGSLTAQLKSHSQQFRVELLGQQQMACTLADANDYIKVGEPVLVREVLLYCNEVAQVFARSLLPLSSLTGAGQQLANLGTKPLGQVLFNSPSVVRQSIELACFSSDSTVASLARQLKQTSNKNLWGRRSIFMVDDKPIMVAEVFLPHAFAYTANFLSTQEQSNTNTEEYNDNTIDG